METKTVQKICVCGAGTMGRGIAQAAIQNGFDCILFDVQQIATKQAFDSIGQTLEMLAGKGKIQPGEKEMMISRLNVTNEISDCQADLIIEAVVEMSQIKVELFNQLTALNGKETVLATNTSSLPVTQIAHDVKHPERVIGMHFFNPAPVMKLVEIVKTGYTNDQTVHAATSVVRQMKKTPVLCKDAPGFIVNHVARPFYIESLRILEDGLSDFITIDTLLESSGFKMGPFKLMDLIGNDINFAVSNSVYEQLGRPSRLTPSPIQEEKVRLGELGKKTGKGYYDYSPQAPEGRNSNSPLQGG